MALYSKSFVHPDSNEWVIFIHGAGGSSSIWFQQLKAFKKGFNVLLLDLRGHGHSQTNPDQESYSFDLIIQDIIDLLDEKKIKSAHFVGISLGSMISKLLAISHPERVKSLILGGNIVKLNLKSRVLLFLGNRLKHLVPFMWLYKLFATIILPHKNHIESRRLFIKEAARMDQKEFLKWFRLTKELPKILSLIRNIKPQIPTLCIQGQQDYMFLKELVQSIKSTKERLHVIASCGHVVNVEKPNLFNELSINFLKENT